MTSLAVLRRMRQILSRHSHHPISLLILLHCGSNDRKISSMQLYAIQARFKAWTFPCHLTADTTASLSRPVVHDLVSLGLIVFASRA